MISWSFKYIYFITSIIGKFCGNVLSLLFFGIQFYFAKSEIRPRFLCYFFPELFESLPPPARQLLFFSMDCFWLRWDITNVILIDELIDNVTIYVQKG